LGTIADVVPLTGENRFWVRHGLQWVNRQETLAFQVLKANAKFSKQRMSSTDIGFSIAPQINALGRLEDPRQGVKFLIGSDELETQRLGQVLLQLNEARKEIERAIFDDVQNSIATKAIDIETDGVIIAASKSWAPGVIGLVASRIVGAYGRPTILLQIGNDGMAKGSCRSIPEFNMFDALQDAKELLNSFGGHSLAAGLSLSVKNIPALKECLSRRIKATLTPLDLLPKIRLDAELKLPDAQKKLMDDLEFLEPFGNENRNPTFYVKRVSLVSSPAIFKDVHVKCTIFADGVIKPLIFFNRADIIPLLHKQGPDPFDCAVQVTENHWNGRSNIELVGLDIAL
jgi:single-stranded-DNA-specific exonuclease